MTRFQRTIASSTIAVAAIIAAALALSYASAAPAPMGTANVWVDPNGGSCARSSIPRGYTDIQACRNLRAAYKAAAAGDTVSIVDGFYGSQALPAGSKTVTFRAAGPGRPSFGQFISAATKHHGSGDPDPGSRQLQWALQETLDNAVLYPCGANQTYDDVIVDGLNAADDHGIRGVGHRFTLRNSEVRNIRDQKGFEGGADDMLFENNYWHHITLVTGGVHNECMYVNGGNRSVDPGNLFLGCPTMALFFTNWDNGRPHPRRHDREQHLRPHPRGDDHIWDSGRSLYFGPGASNQNTLVGWSVRYNTFDAGTPRCRRHANPQRHLGRQPRRHRVHERVHVPLQRGPDLRRNRRASRSERRQQPRETERGAVLRQRPGR